MNDKTPQGSQEPIDKTLAILVNEYLKKHNYPTSSATFCAEAHITKTTEENGQQGSFLSDWFRFTFSLLQSMKGSPSNESDVKRFIESSRQLFELHKISSVISSMPNSAGPQASLSGASASLKSEGFSSKFGGQDNGEPPSKVHAGQNQNGKTPSASTPGSKHPHAPASGATNGMSAPPSLGQGNFSQGGGHQLRPQFNLSLPSHSAGALANWPGAQGMSMPGNSMSNPMQQTGDGSTSQMVTYGINGHMSNGSMPPNALQAASGFDPNMMAMQNASPAGLKGSMPQQQFLSPQQQQLLAQQQANQQRNMLLQTSSRYMMQQSMMAAGNVVNPQMASYMNSNPMMGANNNRMIPMYQQREVYAQHHKQVQLLKLQQHTARQQLMANQRGGGNVGQNMGQALGQALGRPGENPAHMGAMGYPGNHALTHPGGAQNPLLMQQMMNMGAMPNFNGTSSAQHPMANGMQNMVSNPSLTPNQTNSNQPGVSNPSQSAPGATSTPNNGNGSSANVNFEALFASMQSSGVNMNGNLANMGSMPNPQTPGSAPTSNEQGKPANQEEDNSKIFGKFIDSDIFSMNDTSGTANSQSVGATGSQIGGDQSGNLDIFTLDPFSHSEFFS